MAGNEYHFITHWRVRGSVEQVADILNDAPDLQRWWPAVYLAVKTVEPGDETGVGKVVDLYTKGWLPYTLRWQFRVTESRYPYGSTIRAWGDFVGSGIWTFKQDGEWVDVSYDWKIVAGKPLLRRLSFLLKPVFSANHRWAMARGEESLRLELARRQASSDEELARIPAPPGSTAVSIPAVLTATAIGAAVLVILTRSVLRRLPRRPATSTAPRTH